LPNDLQQRSQQYIKKHPNKRQAEKIVRRGLLTLNAHLGNVSVDPSDAEQSNADFSRNALSQLGGKGKDAALAFLSQKWHRTTKRDIALSAAFPDFWRTQNRYGSLQCASPNGLPSILFGTAADSDSVVLPSSNRRSPKQLVNEALISVPVYHIFSRISSSVSVVRPVEAAQRNLPLLI
jgi:hypothetical protein